MKEVFIVSAARTPIGSFGGQFAGVQAPKLGAAAIKGALEKAGVAADKVEEVFFGNVCTANVGQAPARQAAIFAGIGEHVPCTTVNKVCASGMKTIMLGAQTIMSGFNDVVVAGGMESMSNVPYYVPKARYGHGYGHAQLIDGLVQDGLSDVYNECAMGVCADNTAEKFGFTREQQDAYAIESYTRSAKSWENGDFANEVVGVEVPQRKGEPLMVDQDEEYKRVKFDKIPKLRPAFNKDGTATAANSSTINDGAAAVVLASLEAIEKYGLVPIAKIVTFADAAQDPMWFTTTPLIAANKALKRADLLVSDIDYFEVNEAFSVVTMAFNKEMGIDASKTNVFGGAVSLGHPIGCSGTRIVVTLANVLKNKGAKYGMAAICNGGGGASSMIIEGL